jgi:carbamoyltransferase
VIILGISEAHEAHACIVRDGELIAAIAEERLTKIKTDSRYPRKSIDSVIKIAGISPEEIDAVAFASKSDWIWQTLYNKHATFSVQDWIEECEIYWKPALLEGKKLSPFLIYDHFKDHSGPGLEDEPYFPFVELARNASPDKWNEIGNEFRYKTIKDHLNIDKDKVHFFRHEDCHKAYGYYSSPSKLDEALIFTLEGGGDDSSATVSMVNKNGEINEYWKSNSVQVGRLYAYITLILGMKPCQHEYKVMGLAPYGTEYHGRNSLEFFRTINRVTGTEIVNDGNVKDLYYSVKDALEGERFDGIAWGIQTWLEEIVCEWVINNCNKYETNNVILSGGVGQNIKASKVLGELDSINHFWAGPISGDGSIGIGAAWLAHKQLAPDCEIKGYTSIYLGTEYDNNDIDRAIDKTDLQHKYKLIQNPSAKQIATWLNDDLILARYSGKMEFGQRALGNRSILANPQRLESVERINQKIKYRDFWMPFTPSMTYEQSKKMLCNPNDLYSPYMTMAFDLEPEYVNAIPAATHPADKTVRAQMLKREDNPQYFDILTEVEEKSGIGCVLNTSFNLHGEAIVESPEDAISTFERSELDMLLFDNVAISRIKNI